MNRPDATWAKVLVVDDQPPNVVLLERMLEQWGYKQVTLTTQSHEVPNLCATLKPDLILLDLQMPKPDGFALSGTWSRASGQNRTFLLISLKF